MVVPGKSLLLWVPIHLLGLQLPLWWSAFIINFTKRSWGLIKHTCAPVGHFHRGLLYGTVTGQEWGHLQCWVTLPSLWSRFKKNKSEAKNWACMLLQALLSGMCTATAAPILHIYQPPARPPFNTELTPTALESSSRLSVQRGPALG